MQFGFPIHPNGRQLCAQHVNADAMHVSWATYAFREELSDVVAFYEQALGGASRAGTHGERAFVLATDAFAHLNVYLAADVARFPSCDVLPVDGERTIVLVSKATPRS